MERGIESLQDIHDSSTEVSNISGNRASISTIVLVLDWRFERSWFLGGDSRREAMEFASSGNFCHFASVFLFQGWVCFCWWFL